MPADLVLTLMKHNFVDAFDHMSLRKGSLTEVSTFVIGKNKITAANIAFFFY